MLCKPFSMRPVNIKYNETKKNPYKIFVQNDLVILHPCLGGKYPLLKRKTFTYDISGKP